MDKKTIHNVNNVLAGIMLAADFLLREIEGPLNQKQKKYIKNILGECKKLKKIVNSL